MARFRRMWGVLFAVAGVAVAAVAGGAACERGDGAPARRSAARPTTPVHATKDRAAVGGHAADHTPVRALLHRLTTRDGGPGAVLALGGEPDGAVLSSGLADVQSDTPMRADSRFRIGSLTKPFVATVVLQLVGEGRVALDTPVERYLPGVVRGHGNDGRRITVRQLLQHTSGIPDYLDHIEPEDVLRAPLTHYDPRALVRLALAHAPDFEPGTNWRYSNTGYLLAGMLIERVTGHPYGDEIRRRVIGPLGLRRTSVPGDGSEIPGPHARGYARTAKDAPPMDITALNPTVAGSSGSMISSAADFDRFLDALLRGRLLHPAQLRQMMRTRPTGSTDGGAYGLGLESHPLPCGGLAWGHDGGIPGYETAGAATAGGRQATVMVNLYPGNTGAQNADMTSAIRTALCEGRSSNPSPGHG
ncbi:beta-lactamase family protein [Streptomyces sp. NBC_00442]|uniref:serine hydrolase domain-containing protein n=1 Tax=Streptomyces sp. NBC_00442 TaxID=2903651 RepID=UPI002E1B9DE3